MTVLCRYDTNPSSSEDSDASGGSGDSKKEKKKEKKPKKAKTIVSIDSNHLTHTHYLNSALNNRAKRGLARKPSKLGGKKYTRPVY